jgi:tRNA modification GTPase
MNETITAVATPHGVGAISIVRVSGEEALKVASKIVKKEESWFKERYMALSNFYDDNGNIIDKGMVVYFKGPRSFTGEDVVEFQTHGGVVIAQLLLKSLLSFGVRLAQGGEFTKRAFLNGKVDLTEAEAIGDLINAKSEEASLQLTKQLNGELKRYVDEVRSSLVNILAYSEVSIDYADEDLPTTILDNIKEKLNSIKENLQITLSGSRRRTAIFEGFRVAIVGRPNVGKSSLLNSLLNYQRAIVSSIEGTTRDSVEEYLTLGTHLVKIIDTAGIRNADDQIEKIGIEKSLEAIESADIVLSLFDSSMELQDDDFRILQLLKDSDKKSFVLLNKSDLPKNIDETEFKSFETISISAKSENSRLLDRLTEYLDQHNSSSEGGILLSSVRQINSIQKTVESIDLSTEPLESGELELFSYHIQDAIDSITEISNPYNYGEMLDEMFGNFCLGK